MVHPTRPLSPHLQIYKVSLTMAMSIIHRLSGVGLYLGMIIIAWWLAAAAAGPAYLDFVYLVFGNWLGQLVLVGFTWALYHHMLSGIRHFFWDTGAGLEPAARLNLTWLALVGGLVLTGLTWIFFVWI
ncbi:Succinate dehydrogenase cytochrome b-556 subunit [hydrothermal vent metagenome]|uniref:Succinate dehydrogenase cytochrome b-556 subunit n=1 Tax=hydrothermal vent metagenome TaxID=652676 RepID=A0A3B0U6B8_9ZZZZ